MFTELGSLNSFFSRVFDYQYLPFWMLIIIAKTLIIKILAPLFFHMGDQFPLPGEGSVANPGDGLAN